MDKFHIKKISEIDKNKLIKFYQTSFSNNKTNLNIINWRYRSGFNNFEPIVLEINDEICGHAGLIANNFKIRDQIETGVWFTDFYVNKKYRSLGYGKLLTKAWMKICPLQLTICNKASLKVFEKMNWSYNNKFLKKLKIQKYLNFISILKRPEISNINTEDLGKLKLKETDNQTISKIANESEKFLSQKLIGIVRDEKWFKWRILDCPYKKNIFIFSHENVDFITEIKIKNNFKILNIIYVSQPTNINLSILFLNFIKSNKIDFISYISKENKFLNIDFPWSRKLNFAYNVKDSSIKNLIEQNFNDLQYIDSDVNFI